MNIIPLVIASRLNSDSEGGGFDISPDTFSGFFGKIFLAMLLLLLGFLIFTFVKTTNSDYYTYNIIVSEKNSTKDVYRIAGTIENELNTTLKSDRIDVDPVWSSTNIRIRYKSAIWNKKKNIEILKGVQDKFEGGVYGE